jgi:D-psicose/D-tagatose/L-ribulose 3-epimerase
MIITRTSIGTSWRSVVRIIFIVQKAGRPAQEYWEGRSFMVVGPGRETVAARKRADTMPAMKFGAHIYLWVERWSSSTLWLIDRARELGLSCLEIACGDDVSFDIPSTRRRAGEMGIQLTLGPGSLWPMELDISDDDPENRRRGLDWHRRNIDLCGELGAVAYTGAIYGHPGRVHRRIPPADEFPRTAENLHRLAEHAGRAGVGLVLEPMSHFRTHLVNTPGQALRLLEMADHPNLRLLLDTYHMVTEVRDYPAAIRAAGDRLWGLHACENDRGAPGGGLLPWPDIIAAALQTPARYILFESYNSALGDFAIRRGMFHNVCPDGDAFVTAAMRHLEPLCRRPGPATAPGLRFAVLRHEQIDHPHLDLLIETAPGQPLATWRCQQWPITGPAPLLRQPDHRRLYLDYEGSISGSRGEVRRIAAGQCTRSVDPAGAWIVEFHTAPPLRLRLQPLGGDHWEATVLA